MSDFEVSLANMARWLKHHDINRGVEIIVHFRNEEQKDFAASVLKQEFDQRRVIVDDIATQAPDHGTMWGLKFSFATGNMVFMK